MSDVDVASPASTDALVRALHRHRLTYTARVASPVLLPVDAAATSAPDLQILEPFGGTPRLIVGNVVVPASDFTLDTATLRWSTGSGAARSSGLLRFRDNGLVASGTISTATTQLAVELQLRPAVYECTLSANAGAHVATGGDGSIQLTGGTVSWDQATWVAAGLRFSYSVTPSSGIGGSSVIVPVFTDTATGTTWSPDPDLASSMTTMTQDLVLQFESYDPPDPDDRSQLPVDQRTFTSVFPWRMLAELSPDTATFVGAIVVDQTATPPVVYAVRATAVDDTPASTTTPTATIRRTVDADAAPPVDPSTFTPNLDPTPLTNMTPYDEVATPQGTQYTEVIQQDAVSDFYDILRSYVPDDLAAFVGPVDQNGKAVLPPFHDDTVRAISKLTGPKGESPADWYPSLAVPYLTAALSHVVDDPGAPLLNAARARNWMNSAMAAAPVYTVQMPALYAHRFGLRYPIQPYLDDQKASAATYAPVVDADAAAWKAEILALLSNAKPEDVKAFTDIADTLATAGHSAFYAYWLFRWATKPPALQHIQAVSLAPGQNNSSFAREVQAVASTLGVLDPSGTFTKQYAKVISLVQLTNVLPQLLSYDGKDDAFDYLVPKLLEAFLDRFADSADPDIQKAVQDLRTAMEEGKTEDLVNGILGIAGAITGAYEWRNLTSKLGKLPGDLTLAVTDLVTAACAAAGLALFIIGLDSWDSLDPLSLANLVSGAIELFVNMGMAILKRGAAIAQIFSTEANPWEALKIILNPLADNVERAQDTVLSGTMQRILGRGRPLPDNDDYLDADLYFQLQVEAEGPAPMTKTEIAFGRNLDEFALRVGAIFAAVNLILSAIALSESSDPMDKAQNGLFLASAALELIAYAGGWVLSVAGITTIAGVLVATIVSACTFVASALAVAGLVVLLVLLRQHHDTPIETFAKGDANDDGYYMPFGYDIESFRARLAAGGPSLAAVTLSAPFTARALHVGTDGSLGFAAPDHTSATSLFLVTDGWGRARLCSTTDTSPSQVLCLALDKDKTLTTAPLDASDEATAQLWKATLLQAPVRIGNPAGPMSGLFTLVPVDATTSFLDLGGPAPQLSATSASVVVTTTTMQPAGLSMGDAVLSTADRDRVFIPRLNVRGSSPLTWTLSPAPPPWLLFDATTGTLTQPLGVAAPVTPQTSYTLTADNGVGRVQATFALSVSAPAMAGV